MLFPGSASGTLLPPILGRCKGLPLRQRGSEHAHWRARVIGLKMRFLHRIDRSWRRLLRSLFSMHEWKFCAMVLESGVACHTICLIFNCCVSDCFMQVVTCGFSVASCRPRALTQFDVHLPLHMLCHILCLLRGWARDLILPNT